MATTQTEVLIVGAGPSGLTAALLLASRGRKVVIIDKNSARSTQSKAIGVQAGTLELFERVFGVDLPEEMIAAGIPAHGGNMHIEDGPDIFVRFDRIPSPYNFILMLAQDQTERILEARLEKLGVRVLREHELVDLAQDKEGITATISDGRMVKAAYVVGCDGAHSKVRSLLGLDFSGDAYVGHFVLADLYLRWKHSYDQVHVFVGKNGAALFFPLKDERRYRLILIPRANHKIDPSGEVDLEFIRREAAPFIPDGIEFSDPLWMTRFKVHHRLTKSMRVDRAFLCGDAAHIHSPVGAQGMNTGIHDALDLCDRLDKILAGKASDTEELLEAFNRERHANAARVVKFTDILFRIVLAPENFLSRMARKYIVPKVLSRLPLQKTVLRLMSEVDVARRIADRITK